MKKINSSQIALAITLVCASAHSLAQTTPNIGDAMRQVQPPVVPAKPQPTLPSVGGVQIEAPMTALPSGPTVNVRSFEILGNRVIEVAELLALVADGTGKSLTLPELEALTQRITKHYRSAGYFVARAYIPAQEVASGVIKIRVVEGNYGQFHLKNQSLVEDDVVQGMLDDVKSADIVSLDTLERAMLIINDTPGVQVSRADVMPGQRVGTSDFAVDTIATAPYAGYVMVDNYGSVYTGTNRVSFNVDANSVTGRGDRLSASGLATDNGGLLNARVGYTRPLAANGLRGEVAASQTQYQLGNTYSSLDARGTAKALDASVTYPVRRIRAQTIEASFGVAYKDLEDKVQSTNTRTPKTSSSANFGLSLKDERAVVGFDGVTNAGVQLTFGRLDIKDATALTNDAAGAQTQGEFSKLTANISRTSLLPNSFSLTTTLRHQRSFAHKNLDGSERMAVSGSTGVMAYPSGELIGSQATFVRLELAQSLPEWQGMKSSWQVFTDWGTAKAANPLITDVNRSISDVGLGWTANYSNAIIKAHVAHRIQDASPTSEPYARNKFLIQAGYMF